jgi:hypothetical protein
MRRSIAFAAYGYHISLQKLSFIQEIEPSTVQAFLSHLILLLQLKDPAEKKR